MPYFERARAINYESLAVQVLTLMRQNSKGSLSQRELSKILGFTYNRVGKWESLNSPFLWEDFVAVCKALHFPIEEIFRNYFFWIGNEAFNTLNCWKSILKISSAKGLTAGSKKKKLSIEISEHPSFSEFLEKIDQRPGVLIGWLAKLIDISQLPEFKEDYEKLKNIEVLVQDPICSLVSACLQLTHYKILPQHDSQVLADLLDIEKSQVDHAIEALIKSGSIKYDGGKLKSHANDFTLVRNANLHNLTKYLVEKAQLKIKSNEATQNSQPNSVLSTRLYPLSQKAAQKINELIIQTHFEIAELISKDSDPPDHLRSILIQSFTLNKQKGAL